MAGNLTDLALWFELIWISMCRKRAEVDDIWNWRRHVISQLKLTFIRHFLHTQKYLKESQRIQE